MTEFYIHDYFSWAAMADLISHIYVWVGAHIFNFSVLYQLVCISGIFGAASFFAKHVRELFDKHGRKFKFLQRFAPLSLFLIWLPLQWVAILIAIETGLSFQAMKIVASLLTAWILIRLISQLIDNRALGKTLSIAIWLIAAMNIIGVLDDGIAIADKIAISFGDIRISALGIIKSFIYLAILLSVASTLSKLFEKRIAHYPNITPSAQVLFAKLLKILFLAIAVLVALEALGIDLTAFAVFGGALGVGIGFGLQKVISNFVSGLILLLERSLKPGDVIAINETYGWVQSLGARYVSLITRDGTEHLIPNEEFITQRVENWSYSNDHIRLTIPIGVSYKSDLDLVMQICADAARGIDRVMEDPAPRCLITGFGDHAIELCVRVWIDDPTEGRANVVSAVYYAIWKKFQEHHIEIPFPQRDVHLKTSPADQ